MEEHIEALRQELEAARRKLEGTSEPDKRERQIGYISGLQVAMYLINKPTMRPLEY